MSVAALTEDEEQHVIRQSTENAPHETFVIKQPDLLYRVPDRSRWDNAHS